MRQEMAALHSGISRRLSANKTQWRHNITNEWGVKIRRSRSYRVNTSFLYFNIDNDSCTAVKA